MKKINVLIFPAGGENAINIHDSLKYSLHFELFGASSNSDYAKAIYKEQNYCLGNFFINEPNFIDNFNEMLERFEIEYIIPTHDTIALYLMENSSKIKAKIVCSPFETSRIANNKALTYEALKDKDYVPLVYNSCESIKEYPVFLKPKVGAGGKRTQIVKSEQQLKEILEENDDMVICEYLPGEEITVDCFTDFNKKLLFVGPRTRERITMGISFESRTIELSDEINKIAQDLNNTFEFNGAWFFQLKKNHSGQYKLMEISIRQAGTMALYRELGVNFAALSLFNAMGMNVNILFNNYKLSLNRRLTNAYKLEYSYDKIYIDFDDTLIVNGKVNTQAIKFLYQCLNSNKKIFLITKHSSDINETLKKYNIEPSMFEEIYLLDDKKRKIDYIDNKNAIFIDNYYMERKEVFDKYNIPVFDVDAIECLIDYSEV